MYEKTVQKAIVYEKTDICNCRIMSKGERLCYIKTFQLDKLLTI